MHVVYIKIVGHVGFFWKIICLIAGRDDEFGRLGPRGPWTMAGVENVSMGIRLYEVEGLHAV